MENSRQQKIDAVREDFLDRDGDSYVKIRRTGRLGWESLIPAGGSYSDILRGCRSEGDLVKEAYGMARDCIVAMDTPYRVTLRLSPEANCTDSRVVWLSTRVFDDPDLSEGQKIDTFIGLAVHEGCHLKWTDFTQMASEPGAVVRNLINILEDERIERLCGEQMPGYANYLKATKYYMFDLYLRRKAAEGAGKALPDGLRLLNAILAMVRYPRALRDADVEEFADELYEVREIIKAYPSTPAEVTSAAKAIYDVIRKYFEKKEEEKEQKREQSSDGSREQSGGGGQGEAQEGESGKADGGKPSPKILGEKVGEALSELEEQASDMGEIAPAPGGGEPLSEDDMAECVRRDGARLAGVCENTVTLGEETDLYSRGLVACDFNWVSVARPDGPVRCTAKARYRQPEQPATAYPQDDGSVKILFDTPQRAITEGQAAVIYADDLVLGGGTIVETVNE